MRRIVLGLVAVVLAGALLTGIYVVHGWSGAGPLDQEIEVTIPQGATLRTTARGLEKVGAVRSAAVFVLGAKLFANGGAGIKAGDYRIPKGASGSQILRILIEGKTIVRLITIAEGLPSVLVREKLMAQEDLTGEIPVPAEGSIMPDSYGFDRGEPRATVLARMQKAMSDYLADAWPKRDPGIVVKTPQEALTLASIVEKETALPSERKMVAGVYANRLRQGIKLQADPTIIYPITRGKPLGRRIRQSEIDAVNAYNTYSMVGLPRGPIANPGRASIDAVLHPETTKALYFVADGKGGHIFAETYEQHLENTRKWFEIRRQRGEM